jgi:hypothetical protein
MENVCHKSNLLRSGKQMDVTAISALFPRRHIMRFSILLAVLVGLCLVPSLASAQQPSSAVVQIAGLSINPNPPPVGTYYTVKATVYSRHNRPVVVRGRIQVPQGDSVTGSPGDITIPAGGTVTFTWTVYCGVNGGTVMVAADVIQEVR